MLPLSSPTVLNVDVDVGVFLPIVSWRYWGRLTFRENSTYSRTLTFICCHINWWSFCPTNSMVTSCLNYPLSNNAPIASPNFLFGMVCKYDGHVWIITKSNNIEKKITTSISSMGLVLAMLFVPTISTLIWRPISTKKKQMGWYFEDPTGCLARGSPQLFFLGKHGFSRPECFNPCSSRMFYVVQYMLFVNKECIHWEFTTTLWYKKEE